MVFGDSWYRLLVYYIWYLSNCLSCDFFSSFGASAVARPEQAKSGHFQFFLIFRCCDWLRHVQLIFLTCWKNRKITQNYHQETEGAIGREIYIIIIRSFTHSRTDWLSLISTLAFKYKHTFIMAIAPITGALKRRAATNVAVGFGKWMIITTMNGNLLFYGPEGQGGKIRHIIESLLDLIISHSVVMFTVQNDQSPSHHSFISIFRRLSKYLKFLSISLVPLKLLKSSKLILPNSPAAVFHSSSLFYIS